MDLQSLFFVVFAVHFCMQIIGSDLLFGIPQAATAEVFLHILYFLRHILN